MKILKIYPKKDNKLRYNYNVNYSLWDFINGDKVILENFNKNLNNYDVVFLPMHSRWENNKNIFNKIKEHRIKTVLFDNDSYKRSFSSDFYHGIDYLFIRDLDMNNHKPLIKNSILKWSIDTNLYKPVYSDRLNISFNCTIAPVYPYRTEIAKFIKPTNYTGKNYIEHLKNSTVGIHASHYKHTHAKIVEFASCGTEIISNKTKNMNDYYPDELITYFNDINHLKKIIKNYKPNIEIQKELRHITEIKHDVRIRSKEVIHEIKKLF